MSALVCETRAIGGRLGGARALRDRFPVAQDDDVRARRHPSARADAQGWGAAAARALDAVIADGSAPDVELPPAEFLPRGSIGPAPRD